jgi:UDP-N-acetylmuramoyl-L-alanyl-D-glutamate--2,6-diaminopimelate ligase
VREQTLFFCVPGATRDGHDLAGDAIAAGAVALVVERQVDAAVPQLVVESVRASMAIAADMFNGAPTERLTVAGVTGTAGKTTTSYLLRSILEADGRHVGLVGTVEWVVGGERRAASRPSTSTCTVTWRSTSRRSAGCSPRSLRRRPR